MKADLTLPPALVDEITEMVIKKFKDTDKETLKAIYQVKEVRECPVKDCSLYPYRMGKRPKGGN